MKSINRTEKRYTLLVILSLIIVFSCIFSWCNVLKVYIIKGFNLVDFILDIVLLAFLSIISLKIFVFTIKEINSYFSTHENMKTKKQYNKIEYDGKSYIEVKYKNSNNVPLKFYARRISKKKACLLVKNENGVIFSKEYISIGYFLKHFYYP